MEDIDLNFPPPDEDRDHTSASNRMLPSSAGEIHSTAESPRHPADLLGQKRKADDELMRKRRYRLTYNKKMRKLAKEAQKEPSKMTKQIERYIATSKRVGERTYKKLREKMENGTATPKEYKSYHIRLRTKEWRSWNPKNEAMYQEKLRYDREQKKAKRKFKQKVTNSIDGSRSEKNE